MATVEMRSTRHSRRTEGALRAYTTVILLTLHRQRIKGAMEISDGAGAAARVLLGMAQLRNPVTPQNMSNAVHTLRGKGIIDTSTDGSRTYSIWLMGDLSEATVRALKNEERWAYAFLCNQPRPSLNCPPPDIEFVGPEVESVDLDLPEEDEDAPSDITSPNTSAVSADTAMLMRIITDQARTIKDLRARLGEPDEGYRISAEVADFLTELL